MTEQDLNSLVRTTLYSVAPDIEGEPVEPDISFREQFEIDSMDFLNFVIGLNKATGIDIPERDYPQLETLDGAVAYLKARRGAP
jgi:acyl carrier protein